MRSADVEKLRGGLIVSCQAPVGTPLCDPQIIAALALTAEQHGAVGVRINSPEHIAATKLRVSVPIIGIEKVVLPESEVYITPTFDVASRVVASGANILAVDATRRPRPQGERFENLIRRIHEELRLPVMADVATFEEGLYAADCGAELIATTLCGYTAESRGAKLPALNLLADLAGKLNVPVICEGGVGSPEQVRQAFDCGAFAVVVGTAITGIGHLVEQFVAASPTSENRIPL
ncbi:MAG TPA: N-acetylmannosamine-6-phosphate 2-epimerase [Blastocatellia bacterium]|nr:N-acetylmannosamine-6-phosphate 2-epimerase [Blastocatellia bacterium]